LSEYCEYWRLAYNEAVSPSMMCRELQKQNLTRKKKTIRSSQSATKRVQILRCEYWEKVKNIDPIAILAGVGNFLPHPSPPLSKGRE